jgi:inosine/xanthosine triphosphate pyrophosphatase family protein
MKKQLLLGTTNQAKVNTVRAAVKSLLVEVLTPRDLGIGVDVREDGGSTEENAEKKARAYFAEAHVPTLAIDGGLHIKRFSEERQPGVLVRRIHGMDGNATDEEVLNYYVRELAKIGGESMGIWKGSIVLIASNGKVFSESFSFEAVLTCRSKGDITPGAPLDAITIDPASGKHYSELSLRERPDFRWIAEFVGRHMEDL